MEQTINNYFPRELNQEHVKSYISSSGFIEANTEEVTLEHLKKDCIIPVFSKDNESTISHAQFINQVYEVARELYPEFEIAAPKIRASHMVKGRIPSAVGKPAKELSEHEKTIYYERCAFLIDIPGITETVNGNTLSLSIGGVRAYNQENLYSKKSLEKFKVFVGFKNWVCTNLCISTDGFSNKIRVGSVSELSEAVQQLVQGYNMEKHLGMMERMSGFSLNEQQFAHLVGKLRMYPYLGKDTEQVFPIALNDGQVTRVVKEYYGCSNFGKEEDGSINLWNLYNLFTEANKSSYIDNSFERSVHAYELVNMLGNSMQNGSANWLLS
ncbi:protein of unknown function [Muriicola jejuensis]|uniref:DUF3871 family protein n=1 Tax=Muriicola jejuensis TaxID=504488 RepID=A0A6P0UAH2_9FLAO|nr:DUF3871 family protein [Muriicola jejuensis]NER10037.1 DUF3871 family protein [Muriicola jejuensis]SMP03562.1 protein of unknown function [Muriicola jejuensis]